MEQLIHKIKTATPDEREMLYASLFEKSRPFVYKIASHYCRACRYDNSFDLEDLMQVGFLSFESAIAAFDPGRGTWPQIASLYVRRAIRLYLKIYHGESLETKITYSLDAPSSEDPDLPLKCLLPDDHQGEMDDGLLRSEIDAAIRSALRAMQDQTASNIIQKIDIDGMSYKEVEKEFGISAARARSMRRGGFHALRRDPVLAKLADSYALDFRTLFYRHKGVVQFRADWSSATEDAALWRIDARGD